MFAGGCVFVAINCPEYVTVQHHLVKHFKVGQHKTIQCKPDSHTWSERHFWAKFLCQFVALPFHAGVRIWANISLDFFKPQAPLNSSILRWNLALESLKLVNKSKLSRVRSPLFKFWLNPLWVLYYWISHLLSLNLIFKMRTIIVLHHGVVMRNKLMNIKQLV